MKNSRIRTLLFGLLLLASIGSYSYINSVSVEETKPKCNMNTYLDENVEKSSELPDVKIFKKIIETGRRLVPATSL
jgi:hypothetical protein